MSARRFTSDLCEGARLIKRARHPVGKWSGSAGVSTTPPLTADRIGLQSGAGRNAYERILDAAAQRVRDGEDRDVRLGRRGTGRIRGDTDPRCTIQKPRRRQGSRPGYRRDAFFSLCSRLPFTEYRRQMRTTWKSCTQSEAITVSFRASLEYPTLKTDHLGNALHVRCGDPISAE